MQGEISELKDKLSKQIKLTESLNIKLGAKENEEQNLQNQLKEATRIKNLQFEEIKQIKEELSNERKVNNSKEEELHNLRIQFYNSQQNLDLLGNENSSLKSLLEKKREELMVNY
jgi:hypothetical protein